MEEWRMLATDISNDAAMNLAIDEAIFQARIEKAVPRTLRFWRSTRAVVVGYSQNIEAEVNLKVCEREGIQVVRRFTGGGAVYHDLGNINYTLVLDIDHRLICGLDIAGSYEVLCSGVIGGLRQIGVSARFSPPSDIFVGTKKISGSAQSRKRGVVLHHGTLLVDSDLNTLARALDVSEQVMKEKRPTSIKRPVTRLQDETSVKVDIVKLENALIRGFEKAFSIELMPARLIPWEEETAQSLYRNKYSKREWNFWR